MRQDDCADAAALLGAYQDAVTAVKLSHPGIIVSREDRETAKRASRALVIARRAYWQHVQAHCAAETIA